jgi:hypothetical protein
MPLKLDHAANAYITVYLSQNSPFYSDPSALSAAHPALKYAGQVGEMADVKLVSLAKSEWEKPDIKEEIMAKLSSLQGVSSVEAVELQKQRMKRGEL